VYRHDVPGINLAQRERSGGKVLTRQSHRRAVANPPAIILGGSSNAVSVTRSLARAGVAVHALGDPAKQVRWSRYLHEFVPMRGPDVQDRTLEWLATAGPHAGVVLPCDDEGLELVARRRDALVALGYTPTEHADEVLLAMLDKERTYELAHAAGVETPFTTTVRAGDAAAAPDGLAYPCAVKPLQSHVFARHLPGVKALIAAGEADLRRHLELTGSLGVDAMITEIVPGPESAFCSYYSYLDERGEPLFHYTRHKLRQHPLPFGLASYATNDEQPEAERIGERFFRAAGLRGLGNVEFKRDARDGRLKLIECNSRFTAADRHLWLCGLDLPAFVYNRLLGRALPPMETRRFGVRFWHPLQDTTTFLAGRRAGALTLRSWVRSLAHRQHFPVADVRDPMPTVGHHAQLVARIAKDAARARRARR
jgi:predicted ATP-grasp superfamily ATP-dependent carboligase